MTMTGYMTPSSFSTTPLLHLSYLLALVRFSPLISPPGDGVVDSTDEVVGGDVNRDGVVDEMDVTPSPTGVDTPAPALGGGGGIGGGAGGAGTSAPTAAPTGADGSRDIGITDDDMSMDVNGDGKVDSADDINGKPRLFRPSVDGESVPPPILPSGSGRMGLNARRINVKATSSSYTQHVCSRIPLRAERQPNTSRGCIQLRCGGPLRRSGAFPDALLRSAF